MFFLKFSQIKNQRCDLDSCFKESFSCLRLFLIDALRNKSMFSKPVNFVFILKGILNDRLFIRTYKILFYSINSNFCCHQFF